MNSTQVLSGYYTVEITSYSTTQCRAITWLITGVALDQILMTQKRPSWRRRVMMLLFGIAAAASSKKAKNVNRYNTTSYSNFAASNLNSVFTEPAFCLFD